MGVLTTIQLCQTRFGYQIGELSLVYEFGPEYEGLSRRAGGTQTEGALARSDPRSGTRDSSQTVRQDISLLSLPFQASTSCSMGHRFGVSYECYAMRASAEWGRLFGTEGKDTVPAESSKAFTSRGRKASVRRAAAYRRSGPTLTPVRAV